MENKKAFVLRRLFICRLIRLYYLHVLHESGMVSRTCRPRLLGTESGPRSGSHLPMIQSAVFWKKESGHAGHVTHGFAHGVGHGLELAHGVGHGFAFGHVLHGFGQLESSAIRRHDEHRRYRHC